MKLKRPSKGTDGLGKNTSSVPSGDCWNKLKRIMPNRCGMCLIGIGKSMLFYDGTWRQFKHLEEDAHVVRFNGNRITVCGDCFERLEKEKDVGKYLDEHRNF